MSGHASIIQHLPSLLLAAHPPLPDVIDEHAAVLLLWCDNGGLPVTVLTRRSAHLPVHPGQISLPGGRVEPADTSLEMTALRETEEEIGLPPASVEVLGRLPTTTVSSGFIVTPVVARCATLPALRANEDEVESIFTLPMQRVLNVNAYGHDSLVRDGVTRQFRFLRHGEHYIWGATARILLSLAERVQSLNR